MPYFEVIWNEEPGGNLEHIAEHDLTPEDVEEVIFNPVDRDKHQRTSSVAYFV